MMIIMSPLAHLSITFISTSLACWDLPHRPIVTPLWFSLCLSGRTHLSLNSAAKRCGQNWTTRWITLYSSDWKGGGREGRREGEREGGRERETEREGEGGGGREREKGGGGREKEGGRRREGGEREEREDEREKRKGRGKGGRKRSDVEQQLKQMIGTKWRQQDILAHCARTWQEKKTTARLSACTYESVAMIIGWHVRVPNTKWAVCVKMYLWY